ncbi:hypothetical protein TELCIR_14320, partial [Teladorsagia circumcincta]
MPTEVTTGSAVICAAVPQKDPDEENEPSWRITVNPSAELFGSQRLRQLIDRLYHQQKLLSANDAKQVLSALQAIDPSSDLLLPLLTVLSNATAYPANQVLSALQAIDPSSDLLLPLLTVLSNATAYPANQKTYFKFVVRVDSVYKLGTARSSREVQVQRCKIRRARVGGIVFKGVRMLIENTILMRELRITERVAEMICSPRHGWSRSCRVMLLQCLANMAVCPENHEIVRCAIPHAVQRLSLNDEMEVVVALQALTNLSLNITTEQDPFRNPAHTLYHSIYGPKGREELEERARELTHHPNADVCNKAS